MSSQHSLDSNRAIHIHQLRKCHVSEDAARASHARARHAAARFSATADAPGHLLPRAAQQSPCGSASRDASKCIKSYTKSIIPMPHPHAVVEARRSNSACPQSATALTTRTQPPVSASHAIQRQRNRATALHRATRRHCEEHARPHFASARTMRHDRCAIVCPRAYLCGSRSSAADSAVTS